MASKATTKFSAEAATTLCRTGRQRHDSLGGSGNDRLFGQSGNDTHGGSGRDEFVYRSTEGDDTITDFSRVADHVDIQDADEAGLRSFYGDTIEAGDPGVFNANGILVIDFGVAPFSVASGSGDLFFNGLGAQALTVGDDIF